MLVLKFLFLLQWTSAVLDRQTNCFNIESGTFPCCLYMLLMYDCVCVCVHVCLMQSFFSISKPVCIITVGCINYSDNHYRVIFLDGSGIWKRCPFWMLNGVLYLQHTHIPFHSHSDCVMCFSGGSRDTACVRVASGAVGNSLPWGFPLVVPHSPKS